MFARMRSIHCLALLVIVFVSGGATCVPQRGTLNFPPPPNVLAETPSLSQVVSAVNRTDAIRQLSTNSATIKDLVGRAPRLEATVNLERERRFRLRANLSIMLGAALDIGSNDQVFWFEFPDGGITRTMFFARHDAYRRQQHRAIIPIDPAWLIEAIGLVHLDPVRVIAGPVRRSDGLLEVRSRMPDGTHQQVCYIDPVGGYVTQQLVTRPLAGGGETLVAESRTGDHRYYEGVECVLPHTIQVRLLPTGGPEMHLRIEVGDYAVNQLLSGDPNLFVMPQTASEIRDLTRLSFRPPVPSSGTYVADRSLAAPLRGLK